MLAPDSRVEIEAERPFEMVVPSTDPSSRAVRCAVTRVAGRVAAIAGDTLHLVRIRSVRTAPGAMSVCRSPQVAMVVTAVPGLVVKVGAPESDE